MILQHTSYIVRRKYLVHTLSSFSLSLHHFEFKVGFYTQWVMNKKIPRRVTQGVIIHVSIITGLRVLIFDQHSTMYTARNIIEACARGDCTALQQLVKNASIAEMCTVCEEPLNIYSSRLFHSDVQFSALVRPPLIIIFKYLNFGRSISAKDLLTGILQHRFQLHGTVDTSMLVVHYTSLAITIMWTLWSFC